MSEQSSPTRSGGGITYFYDARGRQVNAVKELRPEPPTMCPNCRRPLVFWVWGREKGGGWPVLRCDGRFGLWPLVGNWIRNWHFADGRCFTWQFPPWDDGRERIHNWHQYVNSRILRIEQHGPHQL